MSAGKCRPSCLGFNVLNALRHTTYSSPCSAWRKPVYNLQNHTSLMFRWWLWCVWCANDSLGMTAQYLSNHLKLTMDRSNFLLENVYILSHCLKAIYWAWSAYSHGLTYRKLEVNDFIHQYRHIKNNIQPSCTSNITYLKAKQVLSQLCWSHVTTGGVFIDGKLLKTFRNILQNLYIYKDIHAFEWIPQAKYLSHVIYQRFVCMRRMLWI